MEIEMAFYTKGTDLSIYIPIPNNKGRKVSVYRSSNIFLNRSSNIFLNQYILSSNYILPSMTPVSKKLFTKLYITLNATGK
jgi:hypothetical protein